MKFTPANIKKIYNENFAAANTGISTSSLDFNIAKAAGYVLDLIGAAKKCQTGFILRYI